MSTKSPSRVAVAIIGAVLALLAGTVIAFTHDDVNTGHTTITVTLGGPGHSKVALTPAGQAQVIGQAVKATVTPRAAHTNLAAQAALTPAASEHNNSERPTGQAAIPDRPPLASPSVPGCRTRLVRNYSYRNGAPVLLGVVHLTDSPPDSSWAGVNANTSWFDSSAAAASSNEIMSRAGLCNLVVPEYLKAWTQAGFNPWSVSVEVTTNEQPATFMTPAGDLALSKLIYGWHKRWGIPIRRGAVSGCRVVRSGIVQHNDLGDCGGGHSDILPYSVTRVITNARRYAASQNVRPVDRRRCTKLNHFRHDRAGRDSRTHKPVSLYRIKKNVARRKILERHHIHCTSAGALRA